MANRVKLGVNVDHVATLRQARRASYPDPVLAAAFAELGGADQITVHLREDRRHIQDRDVQLIRQTVRTRLNLEMAATPEMVQVAFAAKPDVVTLVPERRQEVTTEGGVDAINGRESLKKIVKTLRDGEIEVSLFIDPDIDQVKAAHRADAQAVEIHTGRFCDARPGKDQARELARVVEAIRTAQKLGLRVAAGHGLNYENVRLIAVLPEITELNIGHSIIARAVFVGMERAVRDMIDLIARA